MTGLILRARRVQILDIEFTHSPNPEEDAALTNHSATPVAVLEPSTLAKWINHTKPSLLQLAVAVTTSRNPIVNEAALVETILIHTRGATKLNKLWLHNLDLDLPTIQGAPQGTFPIMAASLKPRRMSQVFVEHFLAQSPKLLFMNVDLATEEQELTFASERLQRLAITVLAGTRVNSLTVNMPSLMRLKVESPYPFGPLHASQCTKLSHVNVRVFSTGPEVEDKFRVNLAPELRELQGATFHVPNLSWQRVKAMVGHAPSVQHVAFTRSMDSVLSRMDLEVEEMIRTFPRLVSAYFGEAIFCDMMGQGGAENWRGQSKWRELQAMRVVTTTTSREFVIAIAKLLRKCPNLMVLEIARPYGCEEDRVAAAVAGTESALGICSRISPLSFPLQFCTACWFSFAHFSSVPSLPFGTASWRGMLSCEAG